MKVKVIAQKPEDGSGLHANLGEYISALQRIQNKIPVENRKNAIIRLGEFYIDYDYSEKTHHGIEISYMRDSTPEEME